MAPECIESLSAVGPPADLYAVAAVGYQLLTGRTLFDETSLEDLCRRHVEGEVVPPSQLLGRPLPAGLEELLLAGLEKDPARRPPSAKAFEEALGALALDWGGEDARAWWLTYRAGGHPAEEDARSSLAPSGAATQPSTPKALRPQLVVRGAQ